MTWEEIQNHKTLSIPTWKILAGIILSIFILSAMPFGLVIILAVYFLPTIFAYNHKNCNSITLLNLFLGWTFIGWVIALVWAFKED